MAINFPDNPANNQVFTSNGKGWKWDGTKWVSSGSSNYQDLGSVTASIIPQANITYDLGSSTNRWRDLYLSGNTLHLGTTSLSIDAEGALQTSTANGESVAIGGGGVTPYANVALLPPAQDSSTGDMAYVEDNKGVYLYNGTVWYKMLTASTPNDAPAITIQPDGSYQLASNGEATVITLSGQDPEGTPITWNYTVTSGTVGNTATITQDGNEFTITPSEETGDEGQFELTFTASDGVNISNSRPTLVILKFSYDYKDLTQQALLYPDAIDSNIYFSRPISQFGNDEIPQTIAYDRDILVVASPLRSIINVFDTSDSHNGNWTETQILQKPDGFSVESSNFGASVSLKNGILIVGHLGAVDDSSGRVHIYELQSNKTFSLIQTLSESDVTGVTQSSLSEEYGSSVSLNGDASVLAVGGQSMGVSNSYGGVHILDWNSSNQQFEHRQFINYPFSNNRDFGRSVSLSDNGQILAVGDPNCPQNQTYGAVYIYDTIPDGQTYTLRTQFTHSLSSSSYGFGYMGVRVKATNNYVAVSVPDYGYYRAQGGYQVRGTGISYIYRKDPTAHTWSTVASNRGPTSLGSGTYYMWVRPIDAFENDQEYLCLWGLPRNSNQGVVDDGVFRRTHYDKETEAWSGLTGTYGYDGTGGNSGYNDQILGTERDSYFGSVGAIDSATGKIAIGAHGQDQNSYPNSGRVVIYQAG